jgi:hypothetical protein
MVHREPLDSLKRRVAGLRGVGHKWVHWGVGWPARNGRTNMKKIGMVVLVLSGLGTAGSAFADSRTGVTCVPKTSTDAGRIRYSGNRVLNSSTTNSATVVCDLGNATGATSGVTVRNSNPATNIGCTGYYYVTGLLSNAGTKFSSGTGYQQLSWNSVNIGEVWSVECTLPAATGAATSQMSSVEAAF